MKNINISFINIIYHRPNTVLEGFTFKCLRITGVVFGKFIWYTIPVIPMDYNIEQTRNLDKLVNSFNEENL